MISLSNDTRLVLDKGHVKLIDHMGDDLRVANAARASYEKEHGEFAPGDARLISFLIREGHTSPFRHVTMTLGFRAPLMVARQHWKYVVGSDHTMDGWNESSRRYVSENEQFYIPKADQWRSAPENSKQGSGEPVPLDIGSLAMSMLMEHVDKSMSLYHWALESGICAEQARLYLPAYGLYVSYWWTASLQSVLHFLTQRMEHDAQKEIQDYAKAVKSLLQEHFPVTFQTFGL